MSLIVTSDILCGSKKVSAVTGFSQTDYEQELSMHGNPYNL